MLKKYSFPHLFAIDGLRAIAVLAVLIFHAQAGSLLRGGFTGVDIFLVISGYVISRSLYHRTTTNFLTYLSEFYKRRIKRILPALLVCLLVTVLLATLFIPSSWLSSTIDDTGLAAFWGVSNFSLVFNNDGYFSPKVEYIPFLHTWSLAVEEQFYLIFPVLFYFWLNAERKNNTGRVLPWLVLLLPSVGSFVWAIYETTVFPERAFYLIPSRFWELAAGAILFQLHTRGIFIPKSKRSTGIYSVTGLILIGAGLLYADRLLFPFPYVILPVSGTLLMLSTAVCRYEDNTVVQRALSSGVLRYIGNISYSLYLWHWPVAVLLRWTVGMESLTSLWVYYTLSFVLAMLSYHLLEKPIKESRVLSAAKNWQIIAGGLAVIMLAFFGAREIIDAKGTLSLSVTKDSYIWRSRKYTRDRVGVVAESGSNIKHKKIFILGDSHTAAYRTMLNITAAKLGVDVYEYEAGGCAVAGLLQANAKIPGLTEFYKNSFEMIKKTAQPGDIVFLASLRMPEIKGEDDDNVVLEKYFSQKEENNRVVARDDADRIISDFEELGLYVLIDAPKPVLRSSPYRCADWFNRSNPAGRLGMSVQRSYLEKLRQPVLESLTILREKHKYLHIWDPFPVLCTGVEFNAFDEGGLPVFFDSDHLSAHGNRLLVASFIKKVLEIWAQN